MPDCDIEWRSSMGRVMVTPSAMPVGRMVTLWTGSQPGQHGGDERVTGLVVGGHLLLGVAHHDGFAALADHHPIAGVLEVAGPDDVVALRARRTGRPR